MARFILAASPFVLLLACGDEAGNGVNGSNGGGDVTVQQCTASAEAAIAGGCDSPSRDCNFTLLANACTASNAALVVDVVDCLTAGDTCQTPFDPSGSRTCLESAVSGSGATHLDGLVAAANAACPGNGFELAVRVYGAIAGPGSAFSTCIDGVETCDAFEDCFAGSFPPAPATCN